MLPLKSQQGTHSGRRWQGRTCAVHTATACFLSRASRALTVEDDGRAEHAPGVDSAAGEDGCRPDVHRQGDADNQGPNGTCMHGNLVYPLQCSRAMLTRIGCTPFNPLLMELIPVSAQKIDALIDPQVSILRSTKNRCADRCADRPASRGFRVQIVTQSPMRTPHPILPARSGPCLAEECSIMPACSG